MFKARCKHTGRLVALKKILMENEKEGVRESPFFNKGLDLDVLRDAFQFPITALREVKMLQRLKDKHITELIEICSSKRECRHFPRLFMNIGRIVMID